LKKKISEKDLKDWQNFIENKDPVNNKDFNLDQVKQQKPQIKKIDLHGNTIVEANNRVKEVLQTFYKENISKVIIITGKGNRSNNENNPYVSKDLSLLKNSVPDFLQNNEEMKKIIISMSKADIRDGGEGAFYVFLRKFKE
tara:strand:- start:56 stop:478 length:423 start_codon:yes stop_codon:yes gene_type:complete